jgi:RHS repeat-associated protein
VHFPYRTDPLGRPVKPLFADSTFTETGYDSAGRRISSKDQGGTVTTYEYDAQSRLKAVINALGHRTEYAYDNFGRQTQQKDALGRVTQYQYDTLGRRVGRTLPLGQEESVSYDAAGQMLSRTDFNGRTSTYAYDLMGRVLSRTPAAHFSGEPAITYTYNAKGQRLSMTDATGTITYAYDTRDRLIQKTTPQGTLHYSYDVGGNLTSITTSTNGGASMAYSYDALATVTDLNNQTTTYNYDDVGNLAGTALPNGVSSTYTYSTVNRLLDLVSQKSGNTVASYGYTLAATGHRLIASEAVGVPPLGGTVRNVTYTYDSIHRLTGESVSATSAPSAVNSTPSGSSQWTYDAVSNRQTQTSTLPGIPNQSFAYDANDRLTSDTHDQNGNTISGTIQTSALSASSAVNPPPITGTDTYDSQDRLIGRQASDTSYVSIKYNGEGHRVEQTVFRFDTNTTTTTKWLVDGLNPTGYAHVIEEHTSQNGSPSNLCAVFIYGHDLISQDRNAANQWTLSYYGYDGHGNVRYLTNAAGQITDTFDYDAWGQLLHTTGATTNPYLYTGEQYDPALGLYHLRARVMNPLTGRFWNMDTYEGSGAEPASLHKYLYANADPVQGIDPSGRFTVAGMLTAIRTLGVVLRRVAIGGLIGGTAGGAFGGLISGFMHVLQNRSFEGLGAAVLQGIKSGAIMGAAVGGLGGLGPMGLAIGLSASFGVRASSRGQGRCCSIASCTG